MKSEATPGREELLDFDTLLSKWQDGHDRSCASRQYHCSCGFNLAAEELLGMLDDRDARFERVFKTASPELLKSLARTWRSVAIRRGNPSPDPDSMNERRIAEDTRLASNVREALTAMKPFAEIAPYVEFTPHRDGEKVHEQQDPATGKWHHLWRKDFREIKRAYDAALSAPVPPADGTLDLTNHHNALKCPYCNPQGLSFASPSGAGAAEPTGWLWRSQDDLEWKYSPGPKEPECWKTRQPVYATPPVRGEREAIARAIAGDCSNYMLCDRSGPSERAYRLADAILSLPVQPGAARLDREAFYAILKKYIPQESIDEAWQELKEADPVQPGAGERVMMPLHLSDEQADAALRATAVWLEVKGSQLTVNREKMKARYRCLVAFILSRQPSDEITSDQSTWLNERAAERRQQWADHESRQAPHSSREGGR